MGSNWLVLGLVLYIIIPNRTTYLDKKRDIIRIYSATVRGPVGVWYIILLSVLTIVESKLIISKYFVCTYFGHMVTI